MDELPPPVDVDYGFASYKSKVEITDNVLRYTRAWQVKDVMVPTSKLDDLKRLYRHIAMDERSSAVLRRASQ